MEIVPILSTIILVGTIATFILAVAAYVLYKIRERKGRGRKAEAPAMEAMPEPHVLVAPGQQHPGLGMALPGGQNMALPGGMPGAMPGQASPASMYIAPTTTLPPQGPIVEFQDHPDYPGEQQWGMQDYDQYDQGAPAYEPQQGDYGYPTTPRVPPPHITPPDAGPRKAAKPGAVEKSSSSLFWEYTDDGFVPVNTGQKQQPGGSSPAPYQPPAPGRPSDRQSKEEDDDGFAWL